MDSILPRDLLPDPSVDRLPLAGGRHHPGRDDRPDRARQPRPRARRQRKRRLAHDHGRSRPPQRRFGRVDGNVRRPRRAMGEGERPSRRVGRPLERRRQFLRQRHQGAAAADAVGNPRPRRLSCDPAGDDRRCDDRRLHHDGTRARADRGRDRQLAGLCGGARQRPAPVGASCPGCRGTATSPICRSQPAVSRSSP